jgi:tripartite-type tricarboxylate transporter receptor subunit TctC
MKTLLRSLIAGALLLGAAARAETYPSKPITIIVPFGPGGIFQLARGARDLRQGPARQVGQDDQGRRHPAGVRARACA